MIMKTIKFVGTMIGIAIFFAELWFIMVIGTAWENQVRCENGAKMYCETEITEGE